MLTFLGYPRSDGKVGVRNHVICIATVNCANGVVEGIAKQVPGVIPLIHTDGCGTKPKSPYFSKALYNLCLHPNNYAVVLIGLGCERDNAKELAPQLQEAGKPVFCGVIQTDGGCKKVIRDGAEAAKKFLAEAATLPRQEIPVSRLILAAETGASICAEAGRTACAGERSEEESAIGAVRQVSDWLVSQGGTVILPTAALGNERDFIRAGIAYKVLTYGESLGNYKGYAKMDYNNGAIAGPEKGMFVPDPSEALLGMFAAGAQIGFFASGRCVPLGFPSAPVYKYCPDTQNMPEEADLSGLYSIDAGVQLGQALLDTASGKETVAEREKDDLLCFYRRTLTY